MRARFTTALRPLAVAGEALFLVAGAARGADRLISNPFAAAGSDDGSDDD